MVEDTGIDDNSDDDENKTIKILLSKNSNKVTGYLIYNTKQAFIQLKQLLIKTPIF